MLDSCGNSWTGETPEAQPRRLTASPAESEHPGAEINYYFLLYNSPTFAKRAFLKEKNIKIRPYILLIPHNGSKITFVLNRNHYSY
ncbi:hypothetical protein FZC85_23165 [Rossellomorea aquimaris]|uniref:Uncharacterized protein n=1 Tax=Rossellomorea aquimaris TaxID=189382 RepID=A0A5D4TUX0_9BACI|nr:hypothetical protein FZD05_23250 [Rossellomorea aquimaris]TYS78222.1 hypothetical protein FZC85_23165 [Rossellomorea aquimaris]